MIGGRWPANLATLANAAVGVGAILYTLAGNKPWGMLLVAAGVGFDGLDGLLSRRAGGSGSAFGRVADSVADAITFGLAPLFLIAVHTTDVSRWASWSPWTIAVGVVFAVLAVSRLVYYTLRGFEKGSFIGAPTPQSALAVIVLLLVFDQPAYYAVDPTAFLIGALVAAAVMVIPVPFPKIRRGSPMRMPMTVTGIAVALALVPIQFRPASGSPLFELALAATVVGALGLLSYYLVGPFTVPRAGPNGAAS